MSRPRPKRRSTEAAGAGRPTQPAETFGQLLEHACELYEKHGAALGQIATTACDEALYLLLRALGLSLDSGPEILDRVLTPAEMAKLRHVLHRRVIDRIPAAYLTHEAWLAGQRFYVDERVLIPRSYFLEVIPQLLAAPTNPRRIVDVCTGSGCLAILLAQHFPRAKVDAIDISAGALEVAKINVRDHKLSSRIRLFRSDLFASVPPEASYDLILSNPPYEPSAHIDRLPEEYHEEPRLALDGGRDGMDIVRRLIAEAPARLQPHGQLVIEVGGLRKAVAREFSAFEPHWLPTRDGTDCVVLFQAAALRRR
jgi:ribosomal protein L3 glutamine methyltransferase